MTCVRFFGIVLCVLVCTASAAGASQAASLPGAASGPTPLLAVGALLGAATLRTLVRAAERPAERTGSGKSVQPADVVLPQETSDRTRGIMSWEHFVAQVEGLHRDGGHSTAVLHVRLDGVDQLRRRYGGSVTDQLVLGTAHQIRAHLRSDDTVVKFVPGELFVLLGSSPSDEEVTIVLRRLRTVLAAPLRSVEERHARMVSPTVQAGRAMFGEERLVIEVDDARLVDAPVLSPAVLSGGGAAGARPRRQAG